MFPAHTHAEHYLLHFSSLYTYNFQAYMQGSCILMLNYYWRSLLCAFAHLLINDVYALSDNSIKSDHNMSLSSFQCYSINNKKFFLMNYTVIVKKITLKLLFMNVWNITIRKNDIFYIFRIKYMKIILGMLRNTINIAT
jgi:hypothetical protein